MSFLYSGSSFIPKPIQTALDLKADTTFVEDTSINTPAYSFWVADGRNDINSVLPLIINQGSVVYFSQGSFGGDAIVVSNKNNLAFIGPKSSPPIVELVRAITIASTTQRLRISNFLFGGVATLNGSSCRYSYCDFKENVNIGAGATTYITFENCEFRAGKTITLSNTFASACYFINCNFASATLVLNQSSAVQAIFNNCAGFTAFPAANKSTMVGVNVLSTGVSQNSITKTILSSGSGTAGQVIASGGSGGADTWINSFGGPINSLQYNDNNTGLNGNANLTYNNTTNVLSMKGLLAQQTSNIAISGTPSTKAVQNFTNTISIGNSSATTGQGLGSIAIGTFCGINQNLYSVAIGYAAGGGAEQRQASVAIGWFAGSFQFVNSVAIGSYACYAGTQGRESIAIGRNAARNGQAQQSIAIGFGANTPGTNSVAIGTSAGNGSYSVAIGYSCGSASTISECVVLNATRAALLSPQSGSFVVKPIRNVNGAVVAGLSSLWYNPTTGEISYGTA